jgi:molecular chaperone GrpE
MRQQERKADQEESPTPERDQQNATEVEAVLVDQQQAAADESPDDEVDPELTAYIEELQQRLKQSEDMVEMLQTRFKHAQADLARETDELRARLRRTAEERLESARGEIYKGMLEVADNLERAIKAAEMSGERSTLLDGVKATLTLLLRQLEAGGIKPIIAIGETFDPMLHEAVDMVAVAPELDGKVVDVFQSGYRYGDRLLRPAVVRVGRSS